MTLERYAFHNRLRLLLGLQSMAFTDEDLARIADRYRPYAGKERWDVRQYAGRTGIGTREFRVMRGKRVEDVYCSTQRDLAEAVGAALNALEAEDMH